MNDLERLKLMLPSGLKASGTAVVGDVRSGETFINVDGEQVGGLDLSEVISTNIREGITIDGVLGGTSRRKEVGEWDGYFFIRNFIC